MWSRLAAAMLVALLLSIQPASAAQQELVQTGHTAGEHPASSISAYRSLLITVTDQGSQPLEGVVLGIFDAGLIQPPPAKIYQEGTIVDISQELENARQWEDYKALLENPFTKKNALAAARTDSTGRIELAKMPTIALLAAPIEVPEGYTADVEPLTVPAGGDTEFALVCPYVEVDLTVVNSHTKQATAGIDASILDFDGHELFTWITDKEPKRFIRVPEGEYTVCLTHKGKQSQQKCTVMQSPAQQEIILETWLTGEQAETEERQLALAPAFLWTLGGLGLTAVLEAGWWLLRRLRRRWGGIR